MFCMIKWYSDRQEGTSFIHMESTLPTLAMLICVTQVGASMGSGGAVGRKQNLPQIAHIEGLHE